MSEGEAPIGLVCWTPNDGFSVGMLSTGRATKSYNRGDRRNYEDLAALLRYGKTWRAAGFRCTSRRTGLTCSNRAGHGWWLGRYKSYRLF